MKLLAKNSDYAIRALLYLAQHPDGFICSREIAESEAIPRVFLRRILQVLAKNGLVETREGVGGGAKLLAAPERISVAQVMGLFQGPITLTECLFRRKVCGHRNTCVLRHRLLSIEQLVEREFSQITVQILLNDIRGEKYETENNHHRRGKM